MNLLHWWKHSLARYSARRQEKLNERSKCTQWFLLAGYCEASYLASPRTELLKPIYPPDEVFWADPFAWSRDGRYHVFFEEFPYATRRGRISVIELDGQARPIGAAVPVIEEPYHLSYPFLFEFEGELYMVPEMKQIRRVDIYRCVAFPHRWESVKTLFSGTRMVDSTLFEHQGRWWLFCSVKRRGMRYDETLFAFHADHPLSSRWTPHPGNPVVRDFSRGRPAGRIMRDGEGRLLRPSQDCVRRYGDGLNISEITLLTTSQYREHLLWHQSGEEAGGWEAMHHLDWHRGLMVMDAQRLK